MSLCQCTHRVPAPSRCVATFVCYVSDLVHAGRVESHDGAVRESVEDLSRGRAGVHLLRLEQLADELLAEHRADHILQD